MDERLLLNHHRFSTVDLDEGYSSVQAQWERHTFRSFKGPYALSWYQADLQQVSASFVEMGYDARVFCVPKVDVFRLLMPLRGRIGHRVNGRAATASPERCAVHAPEQELVLDIEPNSLFFLSLAGPFVRSALEKRFGGNGRREAVPPDLDLTAPAAAAFRSLGFWLARELDRTDSILHSSRRSLAAVEEALASLFLDALSPHVARPATRCDDLSRAQVRLIEDWMRAGVGDPLSVDDLAARAGVSVRAMQRAFQRVHGSSPRQVFLKLRLDRARQMLTEAAADTTVTSAAVDCGFFHLGRFSIRYSDAFGESPSATLARGRRRRS